MFELLTAREWDYWVVYFFIWSVSQCQVITVATIEYFTNYNPNPHNHHHPHPAPPPHHHPTLTKTNIVISENLIHAHWTQIYFCIIQFPHFILSICWENLWQTERMRILSDHTQLQWLELASDPYFCKTIRKWGFRALEEQCQMNTFINPTL